MDIDDVKCGKTIERKQLLAGAISASTEN